VHTELQGKHSSLVLVDASCLVIFLLTAAVLRDMIKNITCIKMH